MLPEPKSAPAVLTGNRRETGSACGKDCGMHKGAGMDAERVSGDVKGMTLKTIFNRMRRRHEAIWRVRTGNWRGIGAVSVNSLSDEPCLYLQNQARLAVGRTGSYHTRRRPLFFIPRAAILRGGALSGTFHPNAGRQEDMTITADFSRCGLRARRLARPPSAARRVAGRRMAGPRMAGPRIAGRRTPVSRDALSLRLFRLPEPEPDVAQCPSTGLPAGRGPISQGDVPQGGGFPSGRTAWRASIPSPGFSAGFRASVCNPVCR
jgi:hypothetical protein